MRDDKLREKVINEQIKKAIVKIFVDEEFMGTGFFMTSDGYVLTAYHCIANPPPDEIAIETHSNKRFVAQLEADKSLEDYYFDIAVLKTNCDTEHYLPLGTISGDSKRYELDDVLGVGYPAGERYTPGSYPGQIFRLIDVDNRIEINSIKGPGQSGGPVYHYATDRIIGLASQVMKHEVMTDTGRAIPFDPLFKKWPELEEINSKAAKCWDNRLAQWSKNSTDTHQKNVQNPRVVDSPIVEDVTRRGFMRVALLTVAGAVSSSIVLFPKLPNYIEAIASFFSKNDYTGLQKIDDLETWSKLGKKITIQNEHGDKDIYQGLIFPLFEMKEIDDMKFSSTSVLWGHKSFKDLGGGYISNQACQVIEKALSSSHSKTINIIASTPDIESLHNEYNRTLTDSMTDFAMALHSSNNRHGIVFYENFSINDYTILVKTNNNEFYQINLLNTDQKNNVVQFDGKITVIKLSQAQYKAMAKNFDEDFTQKSISFAEKVKQLRA
ncbi:MAG: hypothetical protein DRR19_22730 [Candidatus Parabeggiatoa sp. nov. 1]|nr:MAG: hypothetical protein DRR19_22730 [Gammaproteobacteria bacterium]